MNPINSIGAVVVKSDDEESLGTAFCYKSPRFLLTAAHIIPNKNTPLAVLFPYVNKILIPTKIALHDTYDIAALACTERHVNNRDVSGIEFFESITSNLELAGDFITYGYPEDISKTKHQN